MAGRLQPVPQRLSRDAIRLRRYAPRRVPNGPNPIGVDRSQPDGRRLVSPHREAGSGPSTFATGGGGTVFEIDVATWLASSMAAGRLSPLGGRPISVAFQTGVEGFDDIRVEMEGSVQGPAIYDIQARHRQPLTSGNEKFRVLVEAGCEVIASDSDTFTGGTRRLALVVGPDSPAHQQLHDLCALARANPSADPLGAVAAARSALRRRWDQLVGAAPQRTPAQLWALLACLDIVAIDLTSRAAHPVIASLNELAALWQPSSTQRASEALNAIFRLMADLIPAGGSVDEESLRERIPSLPASDAEPSRRTRLHRIRSASTARVLGSLRALGVRDDRMLKKLLDHSLADTRPIPDAGIWLIQGDMGVGKSTVLERELHHAVERSLAELDAPVPVRVRATEAVKTPLRELVLSRARETGDPDRTGIWLIVDGLDEAGMNPSDVAEDLVSLHAELPPSTILIGTRPASDAAGLDVHTLRPLDDDALVRLLMLLGVEPMVRYGSEALRSTLQLPLFAVLYAVHRAEGDVSSPAELLERMARSGMRDLATRVPDAIAPLTRLAVSVLDASGAPVPLAGLGLMPADASAFARSRLVELADGLVGFQVAALTEWFGGAALRGDHGLLAAVAADPQRSYMWRHAAASMVAQLTDADVNSAMDVLVDANPALARWALFRATSILRDTPPEPPPAPVAAAAVNRSFRAWHSQLLPTSSLWRADDTQPPLIGVSRTDRSVELAVRALNTEETRRAKASIFRPEPADSFLPSADGVTWLHFRFGRITSGAAWAWGLTAEIFVRHLERMISSGHLAAPCRALFSELLWQYAAATQGGPPRHLLDVDQVAAAARKVRDNLRTSVGDVETIRVGSGNRSWDVATAERLVEHCRRSGIDQIQHPWPRPPWRRLEPESLDTDTLITSLEAASAAGLDAYEQIVNRSLPRLAPYLSLASILPARVRGWVAVIPSPWQQGAFDLDCAWTIEPSSGLTDTSIWEVVDRIEPYFMTDLDDGRSRFEMLRPHAPPNAYGEFTHGCGPWDTAAPATAFALQRLAKDLEAYRWVHHIALDDPPLVAPDLPAEV